MARLFWLILMLAFAGALVAGVSWAIAYNSVGTVLGAPPPQMGTQTTTFLWRAPGQQHRRPVWSFAFGPTLIPGAARVRILVTPTGEVVRTEPADLADRLRAFHNTGY
jgi:hypothetical protein